MNSTKQMLEVLKFGCCRNFFAVDIFAIILSERTAWKTETSVDKEIYEDLRRLIIGVVWSENELERFERKVKWEARKKKLLK